MSKTIYVDASSPGPSRDGTSWSQAYADLQLAIAAALSGDEIRVADGTYKPTSTTDRTRAFQLKPGVGLYGGYAGHGAPSPDARDAVAFRTILSGDIGAAGNVADNSFHVVVGVAGAAADAVFDGFTVTLGNAQSGADRQAGAGLYNVASSPTINNVTFTGNIANLYGGAVYNESCSPTFTNCTFTGNRGQFGGAFYNTAASPSVRNSNFERNIASRDGAGMSNNSGSSPTLVNCRFNGNVTTGIPTFPGFGGGIYNSGSSPTLINCTIAGNAALGGGVGDGAGGGIYNISGASPTLANCIVWGNAASFAPGVITPATITYSAVQGGATGSGNVATDPQLVRVPSAGVDGTWGTSDDDVGDLRLRFTSPAIDAARNVVVPAGVTTDVAGSPRFVDLPGVADTGSGTSPLVDMGAYEAAPGVLASAGAPRAVVTGRSITLQGGGFSTNPGPLTYAWEWTGNGAFDDGSGPTPVFGAAGIPAGTAVTVTVRVMDAASQTATATAVIRVVAPIYVDDSATGGTNNGTSWANAFTSLAAALNAATAGQEIRVAVGVYRPTTTTDRNASFRMKTGVALVGGFAGVGTPNPDARDPQLYNTVLSGNIGSLLSQTDNSYHVVDASGTDATAVLDGFTVSEGNANVGGSDTGRGGGMFNVGGSPTVVSCVFVGNGAANAGGAVFNSASAAPRFTGCTFVGNSVTVATTAAATGGGMHNDASSPVLVDCTFRANSAKDTGGGMHNANGSAPSLSGVTFTLNTAGTTGGAIQNTASSPSILRGTFTGNAASQGGGIYNSSSSPVLTHCVFSGNAGTGVYNLNASGPTLTNCTFAGNSSGAVVNQNGGFPTLVNCILWGNGGAQIGSGNVTWSVVQGGYAGTGNGSADPLFVRNPAAGDDGVWGTTDDDYGDLRLRYTSPAIDAGSNAAVPSGATTDVAGGARFVDIPAKADTGLGAAPLVDLGAYEASPGVTFASAGAPRTVVQGRTITLAGAGFSDAPAALSYAWEWSGNGAFDEATGASPVFDPAGLPAGSVVTVTLRVTDGATGTAFATTTVRVLGAIYVDDSATGANTGASWSDAFTSLESALAAAASGQEIRVAGGTYRPTNGTGRFASFRLKNGVQVLGGYAGGGAANPDVRNPQVHASVLSGDVGVAGDASDNSYHVIKADNVIASAVLDGLTIAGGNANNGGLPDEAGGGLRNISSSPTIVNCTFAGNFALYGGAISNTFGSAPSITGCTFTGNQASLDGGAIRNVASSPSITDCTFVQNSMTGLGGVGGAIHNFSGSAPNILRSRFVGNSAPGNNGYGGAIHNDGASPTLAECTFTGNSANLNGGAIYNDNGASPSIADCTFAGNDAGFGGAVANTRGAAPAIVRGLFLANTAAQGGAMYNEANGSPTLSFCTFDGNSAHDGGAIFNRDGSDGSFADCTFVRNSAAGATGSAGGGMLVLSSAPALTRCTFVANTARSEGGGVANFSADPSFTDCTFVENVCLDASNTFGGNGGGMSNRASLPTLVNCSFVRNRAVGSGAFGGNGGGMYNTASSDARLSGCSFLGNSAVAPAGTSGDGGGMFNDSQASADATNCVFVGNTASGEGGGTYETYDLGSFINCTFSSNSAQYGGGMYNGGAPSVFNCVFRDDEASVDGDEIYNDPDEGSVVVLMNSAVEGGYAGAAIAADPLFVRNPSAGTDAAWGTADDDYGDLRVRPNSPVIDAGNNNVVSSTVTTDAAGKPRRVDVAAVPDTGAGAAPLIDIGAYEAAAGVVASAGPPRVVTVGGLVTLQGAGFTDAAGPLTYEWEWTGDGQFDNGAGANAVFDSAGLAAPSTVTVTLRVTDGIGQSATGTTTVRVEPAAPVVSSVAVNDGNAQRSRVTSLTVTFVQPVWLETGALTLAGRSGAGAGTTLAISNPSADQRTFVITFVGTSVVGGSLADGIYDLTVLGAKVHAGTATGPSMAADHVFEFHRLFSDGDGDGDSDNADMFQVRGTMNKVSPDPAYRWWWDYDADGDVDNADVFQVRSRRAVSFKNY